MKGNNPVPNTERRWLGNDSGPYLRRLSLRNDLLEGSSVVIFEYPIATCGKVNLLRGINAILLRMSLLSDSN